ncbi:ABC transporter ATP-binding protein [Aquibacillus koreensis]|uniref:ABC transporter ATP-binding protein n=1 Tax=Aquibacillus koreensis TaxID=279446 RepID=A0A9X3WMS9_9BACI|nr:ABC transporter ATP-binding protein [Aquibacillus koreensis]MCT2534403.1 ABC transporter ATP-binding protein [Aquibacillus koreensis]MDC3421710.1 ABC transporter ATP-binding protein [Aquibacillus koreensis]
MAIIKVDQLKKAFDKQDVVKGLSFELTPGKCVALLGPNGAGKTTTLRMLSGLLKQTSGSVTFEGMKENGDIRAYIGYLPQYPVFHNWMTGKEFLVYVGQLAKLTKAEATSRADELLERVGISDAGNRRIGKYSGGMKQRLGIAQAMIHKPMLIMLDEPVSSLDPIGRREVLTLMEELKEQTTILFSTHILSDAEEVSDDLLLMSQGEIVESGSIQELREKHQTSKIHLAFRGEVDTYYEALKHLNSISESAMEKGEIQLLVDNIDQARVDILSLAAKENWPLTKFEISRVSLEELFMKVVKS